MQQPVSAAPAIVFHQQAIEGSDGRASIMSGLREDQKRLDPKWFYDERGSQLFDEITRLPEYYPTRTEKAILKGQRDAIARRCGQRSVLIEPGSGSSEKIRILLEALKPGAYVPIDISAEFLRISAQALADEYPWLPVHAVCADFNNGWPFLDALPAGRRLLFYPGSTIGNLEPAQARAFLGSMARVMGSDGGMLIGVDTHKDTERLNAAYNDSAGVTAAFNRNMLRRLNEMLEASFDETRFEHRAFYNEDLRRIEMHLVSRVHQRVACADEIIEFEAGESLHTENSYKYSVADFAALAESAGLALVDSWLDDEQLFSVHYLESAASP